MKSVGILYDVNSDTTVKWGERLCYGAGGIGIMIVNFVIASFVMIYMTNVAFLDMAILAVLIAVSKVLDGISDIIIGHIIDNTNTRFGKSRVWLLRMCIPASISLILLFRVPARWPDSAKYVYFFVMYNLVNSVFYTFMQIAHFSLLSLMSNDRIEHGMLSTLRSLFTQLTIMFVNMLFIRGLIHFSKDPNNPHTQSAYTKVFMIIGAVIIATSFVCAFGTKERVIGLKSKRDVHNHNFAETIKALFRNKYWVVMIIITILTMTIVGCGITGNIYYATYVLHNPGSMTWMALCSDLPSILVMFVVPYMLKKLDTVWVYQVGGVVAIAGYSILAIFAPAWSGLLIGLIFKGMGLGIIIAVQLSLVAETIKYTEKKSGIFAAGVGNAGVSAADKVGMAIGNIIMGFAMSASGFDATLDIQNIPQPPAVAATSSFLFIMLPLILQSIILILLFFTYRNKAEELHF